MDTNPPLFRNDGHEFKKAFVTQFLAGWVATNYNKYCASDFLRPALEKPPVEDAVYLADKAWDEYVETIHPNWKPQ